MRTTGLKRPLPDGRVHFVGAGGVGMAALAEVLVLMGYEVTGSDLKDSRTTRRLRELGVPVSIGPHKAESVDGAAHVVVSAAIARGNPEIARATELGLPVLSRAELLGVFFRSGRGVAVTGTHGKTTTSSMLAWSLREAGLQPTFFVGGDLNDVGSGAALGRSDLVVAEADEAFGSFLALEPELALVTNVDGDHFEFYADQEAIDDSFVRFLSQRRPGGAAVLCAEDPGIRRVRSRVGDPVVTYGIDSGEFRVEQDREGWTVHRGTDTLGTLRLKVPGRHNALNACGVVAAAVTLGADATAVLGALATFSGVNRRFTIRGEARGVRVVDDYAHNPGKLRATLHAARETYPEARIVALFQPHLYSRTRVLAAELADSLTLADVVVVTDIYGDREHPEPGVSGTLVSDAIRERDSSGRLVAFVPRLQEAAGVVAGLAQAGDLVLTLGAGDVTLASGRILELLGGERDSPAT